MIRGENFFVGCDDTGSVAVAGGCAVHRDPITGPGHPVKNVRVTIAQDGKTYLLGVRDANQHSEIRLEVAVPEELEPGAATLRATDEGGGLAKEMVVIKGPGPQH